MTWHLLQVSDVLDLEFGSALSESVALIAWQPERTLSPLVALFSRTEAERQQEDPSVLVRAFPLLRGFARFPFAQLFPAAPAIVERLLRQTNDSSASPLICTTPFFAAVAELWSGPVIYWLTDLIAEYKGADRSKIEALDRRLCHRATMVCPNSQRIASYLLHTAGCAPGKVQVLPNATRAMNLCPQPPSGPGLLPSDAADLRRPVAGIIGNLAGNMDWNFLEGVIEGSPGLTWLFVGPTSMPIDDRVERESRTKLLQHPRCRFVGAKPYGELAAYARAFDVAVLPYRRHEPTYSGSSTRFYEHLAACRPMVATRGFAELLEKEPLLTLVDTPDQTIEALESLAAVAFEDGLSQARWLASQEGTWQARAESLQAALRQRWPSLQAPDHVQGV